MGHLISGGTKSCGCLRAEPLIKWLNEGGAAITAEWNRRPEAREAARQRGLSTENVEHLRRIAQLPKTKKARRRWSRSPENAERLRRIMQDPEHLQHMSELARSPEWQQRSLRSPEAVAKLREFNQQRLTTHGLSRHSLYQTWCNMLARCENPASISYKNYGGRPNPVKVCPEWHDVREFVAWIEQNLGPRPKGMTLDRIDNDGNYEPGNVKWSTWSEQHRNKRAMAGGELLDAPDTGMWCPTCGEQVRNERAFDKHYREVHAPSRNRKAMAK